MDPFSESIGNETVVYQQPSWGVHGASQSEHRVSRPLADADDLRRGHESVLVYANRAPIRLQPKRWDQVSSWGEGVEGRWSA